MTLLHENWHLEWIGLKEREITTDDQKSNPHCSLFSCVNNRHYERVAPAICTWISVKVSMNQVSIEKIQLWEATLGHWMATSGGNSCKGIALTFTSILVQTQHTSRYVTHSSPAFFIVSKIIFFFPSYLILKKTTLLLFVCVHSATFLPTTMHSLFIENKGGPERNLQDVFLCVCCIESNVDSLHSF